MSDMAQAVRGSLTHGSSMSQSGTGIFDITNEKGILFLLKTIHRSNIDQDIKNNLRDSVFGYSQGTVTENQLMGFIQETGLTIGAEVPPQQSEKTHELKKTQASSLGRMRQVPEFNVPKIKSPAPTPQQDKIVHKVAIRVPTEEIVQPDPIPPSVPKDTVVQPVAETVHFTPESVSSDKTTKAPEVSPKPAEAELKPAERIKEIKRMVNEKVGNPISLIDSHKEIGREYMNALLSAMKISNGGTADEMKAAMDRLEKVFSLVKDLDVSGDIHEDTSASTNFLKKESVAAENIKNESKISVQEAPPEVVPEVITETPVADQQINEPELIIENKSPTESVVVKSEVATDVINNEPADIPAMPMMPDFGHQKNVQAADIPVATPTETKGPMMSVAKEEQLQKLMQQNRIKEVEENKKKDTEERATMDPLMTPEVNAGLKQLLSEWSLFKSSGFFGTGPSGSDHALYKKLAPLTMAAVIAGRFEGATPQIKQSITDYMNGWRYEEGIVHEHAETFEHYLRKVIRQILNKQKSKVK